MCFFWHVFWKSTENAYLVKISNRTLHLWDILLRHYLWLLVLWVLCLNITFKFSAFEIIWYHSNGTDYITIYIELSELWFDLVASRHARAQLQQKHVKAYSRIYMVCDHVWLPVATYCLLQKHMLYNNRAVERVTLLRFLFSKYASLLTGTRFRFPYFRISNC